MIGYININIALFYLLYSKHDNRIDSNDCSLKLLFYQGNILTSVCLVDLNIDSFQN